MSLRLRRLYATLALVSFIICALPIYRMLSQPRDIWWTPRTMMVPLGESQDRVEIDVRGQALPELLRAGALRLSDASGSTVLAPTDVSLRFNNRDRVRAAQLPTLLSAVAGATIAALVGLLLLTNRLAYRGEMPAPKG
jgi:hypothetical protein